jgi:hypothetical protein
MLLLLLLDQLKHLGYHSYCEPTCLRATIPPIMSGQHVLLRMSVRGALSGQWVQSDSSVCGNACAGITTPLPLLPVLTVVPSAQSPPFLHCMTWHNLLRLPSLSNLAACARCFRRCCCRSWRIISTQPLPGRALQVPVGCWLLSPCCCAVSRNIGQRCC